MSTYNYTHNEISYSRTEALKGLEARKAGRAWLKAQEVASTTVDSLSMDELNAAWLDISGRVVINLRAGQLPETAKEAKPEAKPAASNSEAASLMLQAMAMLQPQAAPLDESKVIALIQEHAPKAEPVIKGYSFQAPLAKFETEGRQHAFFPLLVASLHARQHVWLVGPAGGGKTTVVANAASTLGLEHRAISVCAQSTKTDLLGFIDAHGVYRGTAFREAFEHGHVFLLDEADNGNANVLAVLNAALANGEMSFPDKTVKRHANFVTVACANTFGTGASGGYVGRNQLDAATLDRFFFVSMPYDEGLEASFLGITGINSPAFELSSGGKVDPDQWFLMVRTARQSAERNGIKTVISPRATIGGAKLAALGVGLSWLKAGFLFKSLDATSAGKLLS